MTLGELIRILERGDPNFIAPVGFGEGASWRGIYAEIAFPPVDNVTVAKMLEHAHAANGAVMQGYKGGNYRMDMKTRVHLERWGQYCGNDDSFTKEIAAKMAGLLE